MYIVQVAEVVNYCLDKAVSTNISVGAIQPCIQDLLATLYATMPPPGKGKKKLLLGHARHHPAYL